MPDRFYPSIDIDFIEKNIVASGNIVEHGVIKIGSTTAFVCEGTKAMYKRVIIIRELDAGQVCLEQASGLAFRFRFMGELLKWLEEKRNWKEGAYIVNPKET